MVPIQEQKMHARKKKTTKKSSHETVSQCTVHCMAIKIISAVYLHVHMSQNLNTLYTHM